MSQVEQYQDRGGMVVRDHQGEAVQRLSDWATSAQAAMAVAEQLSRSSFVPESFRNKPGEATAAILAGLEVGLQPMAALRSFDVIQGQAAARAVTLRAIVQAQGHEIELVESTATRCKMRGRRRGADAWQEVTWTIDRARQLGVTGKANWKNQPQAMLVARCTSELARLIASDAILGIAYSSEEIADGAGAGVEVPAVTTADPEAPGAATAPVGKKRMSRKRSAPAAPVEDVVDAEVVEDGPVDEDRHLAVQALIDGLTDTQRQTLTDWWKAEQVRSLTKREMTAVDVDRVEAKIAELTATATEDGDPVNVGATAGRNAKMHALVGEIWGKGERESNRQRLISALTEGRTESSKDLTDGEWTDLFEALDAIKAGSMELHLDAWGKWIVRTAVMSS